MTNLAEYKANFDSIRRFDEHGNEYWLARELMAMLGYLKWERFEDAIERAKIACENSGRNQSKHFEFFSTPGKTPKGGRSANNYKLTRYACYLVAMNGDPRKLEIAAAQSYFAVKTFEAETVIPHQVSQIDELKIKLELARLENQRAATEYAILEKREYITKYLPEPVQQKILGYTTVKEVEYRDRVLVGNEVIDEGDTINKSALCYRYGFVTRQGKPDYKKLNAHLTALKIPSEAWKLTPKILENQELRRDYLEELDRQLMVDDRQMWIGE